LKRNSWILIFFEKIIFFSFKKIQTPTCCVYPIKHAKTAIEKNSAKRIVLPLKTYLDMKFLNTLLIIATSSILLLPTACNNEVKQNTTTAISKTTFDNVPELRNRKPALQMGKEWDNVQNYFVKNRDAVVKDPNNIEGRLNLAQLYVMEARVTGEHGHYYPAALQMTDEIIALQPTNQDLLFRTLATKAGVQLSLHQFGNALTTGEAAAKINPYNAQIQGVLVDAHVELGEYDKAVATADKMMALRPDIRSYARVSYLREIHGEVKGAMEALQLAIDAGAPQSEEKCWAMLTFGNLLMEYGKPKEAEKVYEAILQERPNYPFALAALGRLEAKKGNTDKAEAFYKTAIAAIPEVSFYVELAKLYQKNGKKDAAQALLPQITAMMEDDAKHGHVMDLEYAEVYGELASDWATAQKYAQLEYAKRPNNIDVNRALAKIAFHLNDTKAAAKYLAAAARTHSKKPELLAMVSQKG
jgi:tetratricopeptide (TPR) repeat protein